MAERLVRTLRSELLDHVIILNERHLSTDLSEFAGYYSHVRPHPAWPFSLPSPARPHPSEVLSLVRC